MAGLTATGITIKSVDDILADIEADQIANIDPNLNLGPDDVLGQLNGIYAAALSELWELIEEVYQSAYPDTASGQSLSYVAALTGAIRQAATKAELDVHLNGTVGTVVPAGTRCYPDGDPDSLFETTAPATIQEHGATDYVAVTMRAVTEGSTTTAAAGDTLIITSPVSGLSTITTDGATPFAEGLDEETDAQLRQRRELSLAQAGASTVEAIRADMLTVTGVDSCTVFENPSGITDADGLPPYTIEVMVYSAAAPGYTNADVLQQIWLSKPAGTDTYGGENGYVTDSLGIQHLIKFSVPGTTRTYIALTIGVTAEYLGDAAVKAAIEDWAVLKLGVGDDVYASDIINIAADITGVAYVNVSSVKVDDVYPPTTTDLTIASRNLATIAVADIGVTTVGA